MLCDIFGCPNDAGRMAMVSIKIDKSQFFVNDINFHHFKIIHSYHTISFIGAESFFDAFKGMSLGRESYYCYSIVAESVRYCNICITAARFSWGYLNWKGSFSRYQSQSKIIPVTKVAQNSSAFFGTVVPMSRF